MNHFHFLARPGLLVALAMALAAGTSCRSPSQYISPRVKGRVVDGETRQPIQGVHVQRTVEETRPMDPPKGGERLLQSPVVSTDSDGRFELKSVRGLSFLNRLEWFSVSLSFTHPRYERLTKTFQSGATNQPGEPLIQTGDVVLRPQSR